MANLDISFKPQRAYLRKPKASPTGPVVPQAVSGRFRRLKWRVLITCLGLYYVLPFLRWDRGPDQPNQAVLIDLAHGRLYLFFIEIWPQEIYYITGLLILAALILVLINALAGRVWCGYFCPQTVWTDLFLWVERLIEGDRRERLRKHGQSLNSRRAMEIVAKHGAWIVIALLTGGVFALYFEDAPTLLRALATGQASAMSYGWVAILTATTYTLAGFAREQVCTWMCPWPRLQGAIWDPEALIVSYRDHRGEVRMSAKKAADIRAKGEPAGDCVDCLQCVVVCPIGIDIREGPNVACINCGLCVDACDGVMAQLKRRRGLIDYEAWRNIERERSGASARLRPVRPKTLALAASIVVLIAAMAAGLALRGDTKVTVAHDRNPIAVMLLDGRTRNGYTVRIYNKAGEERTFALSVGGLPSAEVTLIGGDLIERVAADTTQEFRLLVTSNERTRRPITVVATDVSSGRFVSANDFFIPHIEVHR
jgi:cytochrome c oxidase accessory protein FixG